MDVRQDDRDGDDIGYCRSIEAYLCRRNDGHLIRIVGPSFDLVRGWSERGVPLKVAFRGIDRYVERSNAKGVRRRPVRIEFCEADVLDLFDQWRRAVGVSIARERRDTDEPGADATDESGSGASRTSLPAHLDRVIARLVAVGTQTEGLAAVAEATRQELAAMRGAGRGVRGAARQAALDRLRALDAELMAAAGAQLTGEQLREIEREAEAELTPFKGRMPSDAYEQARRACFERLVRERMQLPTVALPI